MEKLNLISGGQRLTKEQMKEINGGVARYYCYYLDNNGNQTSTSISINANNGCAAQALADSIAYSDSGGSCCGIDCDYPGETCD